MPRLAALLFLLAFAQSSIPSGPLAMRDFRLRFDPAGTFVLDGDPEWPPMNGTWTISGNEITLKSAPGSKPCANDARYTWSLEGSRFGLDVISDACVDRRMVLDRSRWLPPGTASTSAARNIVRSAGPATTPLRALKASSSDWPTFRGREASGVSDKQNLPDTWNPATGENILWKKKIPGLAHSSPIVFGDTIFVTSAISSRADATFKPGLYGDGDASEDRTPQRWMVYAIDKHTGKIRWERI